MVKTSQKYVSKLHKLHKSWRQGQKPTTLEFVAFSQDKELCVVSALDKYQNRTVEWRRVNNETQLLLSYIQQHKQVVPSTILGWLKLFVFMVLCATIGNKQGSQSNGGVGFEDCNIRSFLDFIHKVRMTLQALRAFK